MWRCCHDVAIQCRLVTLTAGELGQTRSALQSFSWWLVVECRGRFFCEAGDDGHCNSQLGMISSGSKWCLREYDDESSNGERRAKTFVLCSSTNLKRLAGRRHTFLSFSLKNERFDWMPRPRVVHGASFSWHLMDGSKGFDLRSDLSRSLKSNYGYHWSCWNVQGLFWWCAIDVARGKKKDIKRTGE